MKLEFSRQTLEKYSNIKFLKIHQGEPSCSMRMGRQTDRYNESNNRFSILPTRLKRVSPYIEIEV
jgi:hypothetical protein